jgi:hypothetical protein
MKCQQKISKLQVGLSVPDVFTKNVELIVYQICSCCIFVRRFLHEPNGLKFLMLTRGNSDTDGIKQRERSFRFHENVF